MVEVMRGRSREEKVRKREKKKTHLAFYVSVHSPKAHSKEMADRSQRLFYQVDV